MKLNTNPKSLAKVQAHLVAEDGGDTAVVAGQEPGDAFELVISHLAVDPARRLLPHYRTLAHPDWGGAANSSHTGQSRHPVGPAHPTASSRRPSEHAQDQECLQTTPRTPLRPPTSPSRQSIGVTYSTSFSSFQRNRLNSAAGSRASLHSTGSAAHVDLHAAS